jgi:hypothetical protein
VGQLTHAISGALPRYFSQAAQRMVGDWAIKGSGNGQLFLLWAPNTIEKNLVGF